MTGWLDAFADFLVPDACGRRAIEETLDDWREERARAASVGAHLLVNARGVWSLARVLCAVPLKDAARVDVWRLFAFTLLTATVPALIPLATYLASLPGAFTPSELVLLSALLLPNAIASFAPLALAIGAGLKRDRPAPVLATIFVSVVFLVVMFGWIVPAANQHFRVSAWLALASQSGPAPPPGLAEMNAGQLVAMAIGGSASDRWYAVRVINVRLVLVVAAPTMFLLGLAVRNRFGARRWRLAQASGAGAVIALLLLAGLAVPAALQLLDWPIAARLSRFNPELWLAMALAWVTTAGLAWRTRNRTSAP